MTGFVFYPPLDPMHGQHYETELPTNHNINNTNSSVRKIAERKINILEDKLPSLCCVVVFILVILGLVLGVPYLDKTYNTLVRFEVKSLEVNPLTIANDHRLNATNLNLTLSLKNTETTTIMSPFQVLVEYEGMIFSSTIVQATVYPHKHIQRLVLEMNVMSTTQLSQADVDSMAKDLASHNDLEMTVHVRGTNWRFDYMWYGDDKNDMLANCNGIKVRFSSSQPNNTTTTGIRNMVNTPIIYNVQLHANNN